MEVHGDSRPYAGQLEPQLWLQTFPAFKVFNNPHDLQAERSEKMYQYRALEPRQIRLCKFRANSGSESHIACTLEHVSIDNPPSYTSLSYHWGDSQDRHTISVDGRDFTVMPNLHSFLKRYAGLDDFVWIDQICINQSATGSGKESEKSRQVSMMSETYERAAQVRVWLGEEADDTSIAFGCLDKLLHDAYHDDGFVASDAERVALVRLLNCPYWRRVWIVQELFLGSSLVLCCGTYQLAWNGPYAGNGARLMSKIVLEPHKHSIIQSFGGGNDALELWHQACTALNILVFGAWRPGNQRPKLSLCHALASYQKRDCGLECDKVYGLLALVRQDQRIEVDYAKPIVELFLDAVEAMAAWAEVDYTGINFQVCMTACHMAGPIGFRFTIQMLRDAMDYARVVIVDTDAHHVAYDWLLDNVSMATGHSDELKKQWVSFLLHLPWASKAQLQATSADT